MGPGSGDWANGSSGDRACGRDRCGPARRPLSTSFSGWRRGCCAAGTNTGPTRCSSRSGIVRRCRWKRRRQPSGRTEAGCIVRCGRRDHPSRAPEPPGWDRFHCRRGGDGFAEIVGGRAETPFTIERCGRPREHPDDLFRGSMATALLYAWNMIRDSARAFQYLGLTLERLASGSVEASRTARAWVRPRRRHARLRGANGVSELAKVFGGCSAGIQLAGRFRGSPGRKANSIRRPSFQISPMRSSRTHSRSRSTASTTVRRGVSVRHAKGRDFGLPARTAKGRADRRRPRRALPSLLPVRVPAQGRDLHGARGRRRPVGQAIQEHELPDRLDGGEDASRDVPAVDTILFEHDFALVDADDHPGGGPGAQQRRASTLIMPTIRSATGRRTSETRSSWSRQGPQRRLRSRSRRQAVPVTSLASTAPACGLSIDELTPETIARPWSSRSVRPSSRTRRHPPHPFRGRNDRLRLHAGGTAARSRPRTHFAPVDVDEGRNA